MADGVAGVPLLEGKKYHFNIIYNHASSPKSVTTDTIVSRTFTEKVVRELEILGFVSCYYHDRDAIPGKDVFTELFRVVEGSDYTIVILTHGFLQDSWKRYTQKSAFKTLLDGDQNHKFIPIAIGLNEIDLPPELTTKHVLFFTTDWERDVNAWKKLKRLFEENRPVSVSDRDQDLYNVVAVEETNALDGAQPDEFDGDRTESRALDQSIQRPGHPGQSLTIAAQPNGANTVGQVGTGQGVEGEGRNGVTNRGQNVANEPNGVSEVSVGRTSWAHRGETGGEAANRQAENTESSSQDGPEDARQSDPAESEEHFAWNAEFYNNGRNNENLSMNLERRQFVSNPSVDLRRRHEGGANPATAQPRQNTERGDRGNAETDGNISLPGSSLRMDGGDIETSVVNRLEGRGGLEYRRELFDATKTKSIDGLQDSQHEVGPSSIDIEQSKKKLTDMPSATLSNIISSENIPPKNDQSSNIPSDVHPDGPSVDKQTIPKEPYVGLQTTSAPRKQTSEPALSVLSHRNIRDQAETNLMSHSSHGVITGGAGISTHTSAEKSPRTTSLLSSPTEPISTSTSSERQSTVTSPGGDGAQELEDVLYRHSLPSQDDSGVDSELSSHLSRDNSCGSESFTESLSPEGPSGGDIGQHILRGSDRGTPDGSVEGSMTLKDDLPEPLASDETIVSEGSESHIQLKDSSNADSFLPAVERTVGAVDDTMKGHSRNDGDRSELLAAGSDRVYGNDSLLSGSSGMATSARQSLASGFDSTHTTPPKEVETAHQDQKSTSDVQRAQQTVRSLAAKLFPVCKFFMDAITSTEKPF